MSTLPKIVYNNIAVLFDRGVNVWNLTRDQNRVENESASGIIETLSYFERERIAIERRVTSADLQAQLEQFWLYARTGQTFSFWRDRDLAAYWDFEGKSYASNDGVAGTLTRATTAYYVDPTTSLVTSVISGAARFPAGKFGRGMLFERAATNILLRSEELGNAAWTATDLAVTSNSAIVLDPNGGATSEQCVPSASPGVLRQDTATNIGTDEGTFSIYLSIGRSGTAAATIYIIRADTGATLASSEITVTTSWQRFQVSYNNAGTIAANWGVKIDFTVNGEVYYAWGAQLEVGANILWASSYIQTTSAAVTRNIDVLAFAASSIFDDTAKQGSISFWYSPAFSSSQNNLTRYFFTEQNAGAVGIVLYVDTDETLVFKTTDTAGTVMQAVTSAATLTAGTFAHYCVTWDTTIANGLKVYVNGALAATSSNSAFLIDRRGTNFYLGSNGGAISCDGVIDDFQIRKDVLSAAQISDYYNSGHAHGWRRNYYSSMLIDQDSYAPELLPGSWRHRVDFVFKEVLT